MKWYSYLAIIGTVLILTWGAEKLWHKHVLHGSEPIPLTIEGVSVSIEEPNEDNDYFSDLFIISGSSLEPNEPTWYLDIDELKGKELFGIVFYSSTPRRIEAIESRLKTLEESGCEHVLLMDGICAYCNKVIELF